jgi:uncharacterized membrane protein (UPF0136 family)
MSGGGMTQVSDSEYYSAHFCGLKLNNMSTTISHAQGVPAYRPAAGNPSLAAGNPSLIDRFFDWAAKEDVKHHIGWVGFSIVAMTAIFFPVTMSAILLNGASFGLIIAAMVPLVLVFVTTLAALPTRYTIPFIFVGVLAELTIIIMSFLVR